MGDLVEGLGVRYAIIRPTLVFGARREVVPRQRLSLDYTADVNTNMVKPILSIAILIATCLACSGGGDVVKIGTEGEYPPYNFINDSGEVDGFERELGDELCRRRAKDPRKLILSSSS